MSFWKGKKVLVTGHTGFKGSWLSLWLQQAGARWLATLDCRDGARFAEAWNFGPGDDKPLPVGALVERMLEHWDEPVEVEHDPGPHLTSTTCCASIRPRPGSSSAGQPGCRCPKLSTGSSSGIAPTATVAT